jgi:hypothetical protein
MAGLLLGLACLLAARPAGAFGAGATPPFDFQVETRHRLLMSVDATVARDVLALLGKGPDAPAALRRLRAHPLLPGVLEAEGGSAETFFGRLVQAAAGTPDALLAQYAGKLDSYRGVLDTFDAEGVQAAALEGRRVASLLPPEPAVTAQMVILPLFGLTGFSEVRTVRRGDGPTVLAVDLPRVMESLMAPTAREVLLKSLRAAAAEAYRTVFSSSFRAGPGWPDDKGATFEVFLARTVAEGPATLFLFPDEFFPLAPLLEEPIGRAFVRWNRAAEKMLDGDVRENERRELLLESTYGDFWARYTAIVGAQMADALIRSAGRDAYLKALGSGPRAVVGLYLSLKGKNLPSLSKDVRKALEKG